MPPDEALIELLGAAAVAILSVEPDVPTFGDCVPAPPAQYSV